MISLLNTARRQSASGGGGGGGDVFVLDDYPAHVACSLQKLRSDYSGNVIRVRRSSDNAEQDIGFTGIEIDSSSLLTFVGSADGFVTTAYDQVGSNNFTQTNANRQPKVVSSGSLITDTNGLAAMKFDGIADYLINSAIGGHPVLDFYRVGNTTDTSYIFLANGSSKYSYYTQSGGGSSTLHQNYGSPSLYVNNVLKSVSTIGQVYTAISIGTPSVVNHLGANTNTWTGVNTNVGAYSTGGYTYDGLVQSLIFYNADSSTNRSAITTILTDKYVP